MFVVEKYFHSQCVQLKDAVLKHPNNIKNLKFFCNACKTSVIERVKTKED